MNCDMFHNLRLFFTSLTLIDQMFLNIIQTRITENTPTNNMYVSIRVHITPNLPTYLHKHTQPSIGGKPDQ